MNNNLIQRIVTALVAGSATIAAIFFSPYGLWAFCALIAILGYWELTGLLVVPKRPYRVIGLLGGIMIWVIALLQIAAASMLEIPDTAMAVIGMLMFPVLVIFMLFDAKLTAPVTIVAHIVLGFVYCFLPFYLLYEVSMPKLVQDYSPAIPLGILLLTWVLDSGAYFVGRLMGKRPLFPRISPKKTWEGSIGGAMLCIALGFGLNYWLEPGGYNWVIIAVIISIFSQLGDLVESMFKRSMAIKDSGTLLPGHGGVLDRFDGIYVSMPFLFLYFSMV